MVMESYYKFAFVRNPWSRFVSLYELQLNRDRASVRLSSDVSITEYLAKQLDKRTRGATDVCNKSQLEFLTTNGTVKGKLGVDHVFRFEEIVDDWSTVCGKLGISDNLLHTNPSNYTKPYQEYYNNKSKDILYRLFRHDINYWEYEFE